MATFPNWLPLDDDMFQALEPFKVAMDNEEARCSKHPDEITERDRQRIHEIEGLLVQAADRGDEATVAKLEQEMDAILLAPDEREEVA